MLGNFHLGWVRLLCHIAVAVGYAASCCIHPALCGLVFCVALIATVPALKPLGNLLLDEDGTGMCDKLQKQTRLDRTGSLLPGPFFLWCSNRLGDFSGHDIAVDLF
jgi:hypothetical protein